MRGKYIFNRTLLVFVILMSLPTLVRSQEDKSASSSISEADAANQIKTYYNCLNQYLDGIRNKQGQGTARDNINYLFGNKNPQTITEDYRYIEQDDIVELTTKIHLSSYLENFANQNVNVYKLVKGGLSYKLKKTNGYKTVNDSTVQIYAEIEINRTPCIATFRLIGKRIYSITVKRKKLAEINPLEINFSAGWKITNGVNLGVGIDGISKNWFINHLRFGVEYNMLFNQERDAHYPTSSDGTSSTMTYRTRENDDYGLGINIGYRIIPDKYDNVSILGGPGRLFFSMGGGIIRYGRWWEYQGTADPIEHPRNTAFYIKPSVTLEYLLSDFWGIGLEANYYYSPQYSQINGVGLNAIINYAF